MITIISGTNRPGSRTLLVSEICKNYLLSQGHDVEMIDLVELDPSHLSSAMYSSKENTQLSEIQDQKILPADLLLIVSPEYNGSYPGVLKAFFDALSVRKYKDTFKGRKVALLGVSAGRAGNLRGMEHMTGFLNYLNMLVMPNKLPVSSIEQQLTADNQLNDSTMDALSSFLDEVVQFSQIGVASHTVG